MNNLTPVLAVLTTMIFLQQIIDLGEQSFVKEIFFTNSSMEGNHQIGAFPVGWESCIQGATPDILPGYWKVNTKPNDGDSYIGLITRKDGTYESVSQSLTDPLLKGNCYSFTVMLARSSTYENFNYPIRLRILGGSDCHDHLLLDETRLVTNTYWKKYNISFYVNKNIQFITLEAFYGKGVSIKYRGNILIDNLSSIKSCPRA